MLDSELLFILHHVFLPPKLPQSSDDDEEALILLPRILKAAREFSRHVDKKDQYAWNRITANIQTWIRVYSDGAPCESGIEQSIKSMHDGDILLLYVKCQNAAILMRRTPASTIIETFEIQPRTEPVLAAQDALLRTFPAKSVSVPSEKMRDSAFVHQLALQIYRLSTERIALSMEKSVKGNTTVVEERQSAHPMLVTDWLMTTLATVGEPNNSALVINKRTHDEICFKNALKPWRRSPIWLSIKVALQLTAQHLFPENGEWQYKNFMLFLMDQLATEIAAGPHASFDDLHVLRVKIARRHAKLDLKAYEFVSDSALRCLDRIKSSMDRQWRRVAAIESTMIPRIEIRNPKNNFVLDKSFAGLQQVWNRSHALKGSSHSESPLTESNRHVHLRLAIPDFSELSFPDLGGLFSLLAVERWVSMMLQLWMRSRIAVARDCEKLVNLMIAYHKAARALYQTLPEQLSIMFLTITEMWIALDQLAVGFEPLIGDYSLEVPANAFTPLLLSKREEMKRLGKVESYLIRRQSTHNADMSSSVLGVIDANSFAVRYFDASSELKDIKAEIEAKAEIERRVHQVHFDTLCNQQRELKEAAALLDCDEFVFGPRHERAGQRKHDFKCRKCAMKRDANRISIAKHEWPLPNDTHMASAVVFEMKPSLVFVWWRKAMLLMRNDILLTSIRKTTHAKIYLQGTDAHLTPMTGIDRRIKLASSVKPLVKSHYNVQELDDASIFVDHCMRYRYYDTEVQAWLEDQNDERSLSRYCRTVCLSTPSALRSAINETTRHQNNIIAEQDRCPPEFSTAEFVSICSLRAGGNLQWMNLLASLRTGQVNFNNSVVGAIVEQLCHQVGPRRDRQAEQGIRDFHMDLSVESFCSALTATVHSKLSEISGNWQETETAAVLLTIVLRLLSFHVSRSHEAETFKIIRRLRLVVLQWLRCMRSRSDEMQEVGSLHNSYMSLDQRMLTAALVARATWNVEQAHCGELFKLPHDIKDFIECSVHIYNLSSGCEKAQWSEDLVNRKRSDEILAAKLEPILMSMVEEQGEGISHGIQNFVPSLKLSDNWQAITAADGYWFVNVDGDSRGHVQINLLSGKLMIGGRPLRQLPDIYFEDPMYKTIFGNRVINVMTSDDPTMDYQVVRHFNGHTVFLAARGSEVFIRSRSNGRTYQAVPRHLFRDDIPPLLIGNTVAWMDLANGHIVFRDKTWEQSSVNLTLVFDTRSRSSSSLRRGLDTYYISPTSLTGSLIAQVLTHFEKSMYLHMSYDEASGSTEVKLPRYGLSFEVDDQGALYCHELSSFVSQSQSMGTLHGLQTRLILETGGDLANYSKRTVLIPYGLVFILQQAPHVNIHIDTENKRSVQYFRYQIDERLGQLLSNNNLEAHFFKAYLHAITSSPLADSLTMRTGTAESLQNLSDRFTKTTIPLTSQARTILGMIAQLTPRLSFYPAHLQTMQESHWHDELPFLSQHGLFFVTVAEILEYNQQSLALFDDNGVSSLDYLGDITLLHRYLYRSMKYYAAEAVVVNPRQLEDRVYDSRDRQTCRHSRQAYEIASLVSTWPKQVPIQIMLHEIVALSKTISGFQNSFLATKLVDLLNINIARSWPSLLNLCLTSFEEQHQEKLRFEFSMMAFNNSSIIPHLTTLLAFATCDHLKILAAPMEDSYDLDLSSDLDWERIHPIIEKCQMSFAPLVLHDARFKGKYRNENFSDDQLEEINVKARRRYDVQVERQRGELATIIETSWPTDEFTLPIDPSLSQYDSLRLKELLDPLLKIWCKNYRFREYIASYDSVLQTLKGEVRSLNMTMLHVTWAHYTQRTLAFDRPSLLLLMRRRPGVVSSDVRLMDALRYRGLDSSLEPLFLDRAPVTASEKSIQNACELKIGQIVERLQQSSNEEHQKYSASLSLSLSAVKTRTTEPTGGRFWAPSRDRLDEQHLQATSRLRVVAESIRRLLQPNDQGLLGLQKAGLWPEVTNLALLRLLCLRCRHNLPDLWKYTLLCFAEAVTALQRVERIKKYIDIGDDFALHRELDNEAHKSWSVADHPDWLLLEVQNDMLIRPIQIKVAREIMKDENASLMLGMGEGKTSVILPMVVTEIANGSKLLRVIVLKSLASEMLRTLSHSLAGLVDRAVYHLPFSRKTKIDAGVIEAMSTMYKNCMSSHSVLIALPEHLNSFRLVGIDRLSIPNNRYIAEQLLNMQKWLDTNSREVMDECDEILKPAYELVYTNGEAKLLRCAPDRWCVVLDLLSLLRTRVVTLHEHAPESIELENRGPGVYPKVRILKAESFNDLAKNLVDDIVHGRLPGVPPSHLHRDTADALQDFVLNLKPSPIAVSAVTKYFVDAVTLDKIYLLRGLIAHGILLSALSKRWHVNYGLDRSRCLSAVPYRAKSTPSPAAEFAQPEMMVLLTTLSFYYTGLTLEDTRSCLIRLHKLPDPADVYAEWAVDSTLPLELQNSSSVNVEDATCVERIHECLSFNTAFINFFLNHIVFPKEAKEFPKKLSTSAWDLCSETSTKTTSGFSGTGDSLLPLSIPQRNVPDLKHTAASVLCTLVRPENQNYVCFSGDGSRRPKSAKLLSVIAQHEQMPSVIIDVGAQFLEANNRVALQLLLSRPDKKAVVFFDAKDQKWVGHRDGRSETWESSPLRDQTNDCVFYLDEFHTRGTDFHFPDNYCGAVLLGPNLQKDTFVQACMRMRKLGFTQSVVIFAPPEIDDSIRAVVGMAANESLTSYDVLLWTIYNSCTASRNQHVLWLMRGLAHAQRRHAFSEHVKDSGKVVRIPQYLEKIQEIESRSLPDMYKVPEDKMVLPYCFSTTDQCDQITSSLLQRFHDINAEVVFDHDCEQEQEREILHEVEQEREVQRPLAVKPICATVDKDLNAAVRGTLYLTSMMMKPSCFQLLRETSLKTELLPSELPDCVKATDGFLKTIIPSGKAVIDDFLRPVQWVLQIKGNRNIYLISPHEANIFLPLLRTSTTASLSLYSARTSKAAKPFDGLDIYRVPETAFDQQISEQALATLRLFAGQLYFNTLDEYKSFCQILGLWDGRRILDPAGRVVEADLFVPPKCRNANEWICKFRKSPVVRIRKWINMRRHGIEWSHTHVGRVLNGQVLTDRDFE